MNSSINYDVLVIGSGAAGLGLALSLAADARIAIITKDDILTSSSRQAQGGIAAVMNQAQESIESHINDTLNAGAGLCDYDAVEFTVANAPPAIQWLINKGVKFTTKGSSSSFHLNKEGGHSQRRILHAADHTGKAVVKTLAEQVTEHPNIDCLTQHTAIDLMVSDQYCFGASCLLNDTGEIKSIHARFTVLATGGASYIYQHTSNPGKTTGDGIAMAWRAGCLVADMEFNQFHPTCHYNPTGAPFLITEAIRGEGGKLTLPNGNRFMDSYDKKAELAPRDIVARAIDHELKKNKLNYVLLDISHKPSAFIKKSFPMIYEYCLTHGIDITQDPTPVVPAAHYTCGGVVTNQRGQTNINSLYVIGESACTGLHGANRMASNSLLECLVFAQSAANSILQALAQSSKNTTYHASIKAGNTGNTGKVVQTTAPLTSRLRQALWDFVGIVRNGQRLQEASVIVSEVALQCEQHIATYQLSKPLIELRNMAQTAKLMIKCAQWRKESRGLHFSTDYPSTQPSAAHTLLKKSENEDIIAVAYTKPLSSLIK